MYCVSKEVSIERFQLVMGVLDFRKELTNAEKETTLIAIHTIADWKVVPEVARGSANGSA